jgi:hypothetical protein
MVKEDFIKGRWYKNFNFMGTKAKFLKIDSGYLFIGSEWIDKENRYRKKKFATSRIKNAIECSIDEIKHILPPNHPDLINITPKIYELW